MFHLSPPSWFVPSSAGFLPHLLHRMTVLPAVVVPRRCQVGGCCGFSTCSSCWCCCHGYNFFFFWLGSLWLFSARWFVRFWSEPSARTLDTLVFPTLCCLADSP
ncbi:hypothetical protein GQ42DRAFT_163078 [Ramicandelaber brevisporus]|nr:hypothetical protein GQ42DRAFT_163078 [Ramicandelaber brevisporus]